MEKRLAIRMASEAKKQAEFAFIAVLNLDRELNNIGDPNLSFEERNSSMQLFWYNMQMFLVSSANVSKLFWGNPKFPKEAEERKTVREILETSDNSALVSRRLRNHFEHYDSRLVDWYNNSESKSFASEVIGPENTIVGLNPKEIFRHYNPEERVVIFRGEKFKLVPVVRELKRIIGISIPVQ